MGAVTQLRTVSRFRLRFLVRFRWRDRAGSHWGEGTTRDISSKGLFILTDTLPPVNSVIRCWFHFPAIEHSFSQDGYDATAIARVLRTADRGKDIGFAISPRAVVITDRDETS